MISRLEEWGERFCLDLEFQGEVKDFKQSICAARTALPLSHDGPSLSDRPEQKREVGEESGKGAKREAMN